MSSEGSLKYYYRCVAAKTKDTNEYRWRTGRRIQRVIQGSSNGSDLGP